MVPPNNVWENFIKNQCEVTKVWTTLQLQLERTPSRSPMFQHHPWRNGRSSSISLKTRCITADSSSMSSCLASFPNLESCFRSEFSLQARRLTLRIRLGKRQWRLWTMQAVLCKRVLQGLRTWQRAENQREIVFFALVQTFQQRKPWAIARRSWKASWMLPNFSEMLRASPCQAQAKCSQPRRSLVHLFIHSLHNSMQIFRNRRHQFISSFPPWKLQFISFAHGILVGCPTHLWWKYPTHWPIGNGPSNRFLFHQLPMDRNGCLKDAFHLLTLPLQFPPFDLFHWRTEDVQKLLGFFFGNWKLILRLLHVSPWSTSIYYIDKKTKSIQKQKKHSF